MQHSLVSNTLKSHTKPMPESGALPNHALVRARSSSRSRKPPNVARSLTASSFFTRCKRLYSHSPLAFPHNVLTQLQTSLSLWYFVQLVIDGPLTVKHRASDGSHSKPVPHWEIHPRKAPKHWHVTHTPHLVFGVPVVRLQLLDLVQVRPCQPVLVSPCVRFRPPQQRLHSNQCCTMLEQRYNIVHAR